MRYKINYDKELKEDVCICPSCGFKGALPHVINEDITSEGSFKILESLAKDLNDEQSSLK